MDEFVTVFTFIDQANQLLSDFPRQLAIGILPYAIGAAFVVIPAIRIMIVKKVYLLSLGILAFCWVFVGLPLDSQIRDYQSVKQEYRELLDVYNRQAYQVVEGIVSARQTLSPDRRTVTDIVSIGAVEFEIRDFVATVAYATTLAAGGVLKEGAYVRVY